MNAKLSVQCTTVCYTLSPITIGIVKLIVIKTVDGGPDENPHYPMTLNAAYKTFKDHNLDCPGQDVKLHPHRVMSRA